MPEATTPSTQESQPPNELALSQDERLLLATVCRLQADALDTSGFNAYKAASAIDLTKVAGLNDLARAHDLVGTEARRRAGSLRALASLVESAAKVWISRKPAAPAPAPTGGVS